MKVMIFGGTTEGREETAARLNAGDGVVACVTSEYARLLLPAGARVIVRAMDEEEICAAMMGEAPDEVVDATHPFAVRVSENIRRAAARAGLRVRRIARANSANSAWTGDAEWVDSPEEAARALARTRGNILLTTGSHTLCVYARALPLERVYARVLPASNVLRLCEELKLPPGHVIAMQGPFPPALNGALYDALGIRVLLSKDSGEQGGVRDKVLPALERDIHVVMIRMPKEESECAEKA